MTSILLIGYAPEAVDFEDPAAPPGLDEDGVEEGIKEDMRRMHERGWQAEHLPIRFNSDIRKTVTDHLRGRRYDCIVIGAGVRMTENHIPELEQVVNAVREGASATPIGFNSKPTDSLEAAARWLPNS